MRKKPSNVVETLEAVAALLDGEGKWTQGSFARTKSGRQLHDGSSTQAFSYCLVGGFQKVDGAYESEAKEVLRKRLKGSIIDWNDSPRRKQQEVVAVLREVAAKEKAKNVVV